MAETPILPEGTIIGRYTVSRRIGAGAMGEVYQAEDTSLKRKVAIKILAGGHHDRADLRQRFTREARAVAAINHPNVVQIFDIDEYQGRPYFVMEFLTGDDTEAIFRRRGKLNARAVARIGLGTARGLAEAAENDLVHRDIKPANLFVTARDEVKVTDFGLAKALRASETSAALTIKGTTLGTPDYMSPEQCRGEKVDAFADIYSLGCTMFHLLAGYPPFRPEGDDITAMEVLSRHVADPIPRLSPELDLPRDLSDLILRMMSKQPSARPGYRAIVDILRPIAEAPANAPVSLTAATADALEAVPTAATAPAGKAVSRPVATSPRVELDPPRLVPRWALWMTVGSALCFIVSLSLYLFYHPAVHPIRTEIGAREPVTPIAPKGMILARLPGQQPLLVGVEPVTVGQLRRFNAALAEQHYANHDPESLAHGLSYQETLRAIASLGGRLLEAGQWTRLVRGQRIKLHEGTCEWLGRARAGGRAACGSAAGIELRSTKRRYPDAVFRLARNL